MTNAPPLPHNSVYTSCWCEENIYLLCQGFQENPSVQEQWETFVIFISNDDKSVALMSQKASRELNFPVLWDYHVILVLRPRRSASLIGQSPFEFETEGRLSWVYDFDTRLPIPCAWNDYVHHTFHPAFIPRYQAQFRVIEGVKYVQYFASDRSHMLTLSSEPECISLPVYMSLPPPYPHICGPISAANGVTNNLMAKYVYMAEHEDSEDSFNDHLYGVVLDLDGLIFQF